jgi:hypothetical protein
VQPHAEFFACLRLHLYRYVDADVDPPALMYCQYERLPDHRWRCVVCGDTTSHARDEVGIRTCDAATARVLAPAGQPSTFWNFGDHAESLFGAAGITQQRVADWLGSCGGCPERQEKLNRLGRWLGAMLGADVEAKTAAEREVAAEIGPKI